jgi:starch synthase (maltosyl-transferring)
MTKSEGRISSSRGASVFGSSFGIRHSTFFRHSDFGLRHSPGYSPCCVRPVQTLSRRLATVVRRPWPTEPVPVSLVITDLDIGGAERALVALARRLDRRRWRPSVVCLGPEGRLAEPLRAAGIEPVCLGLKPGRPDRALLALARALRKARPWLVQSFLFHANLATRLAAPWAGQPWVLGGNRVAEQRPGKRWHLVLDRLSAGLSAGSVCVSQGVLRFTRDVTGVDPERLIVIPNGIDPAPFDQAEPLPRAAIGLPPEGFCALFVGRLDVQKGLATLLDAAEQVLAEHPDWRLVLVGDGPERPWLERRLAGNPILAAHVRWLGRRDDVPALLKMADVLVLPSLFEGMPNVVLEAMAARRAVVATAVEGTEDLVVPGQTGWLVPPRDPEALARALREAAADPIRCRSFGEAGYERVLAAFSLDRMASAYQKLWADVLGFDEESQ